MYWIYKKALNKNHWFPVCYFAELTNALATLAVCCALNDGGKYKVATLRRRAV